jgi:hypothetical protein
MIAHLGGVGVVTWLDDVGELVAAVTAGVACIWVAHRSEGRYRATWRWLGASALAWAARQAVRSWYELIKGVTVPFPSLADVGFLAAVPLAVVAVLVFPTSPTATSSRVRMVLDGVILAGSLLFISWATTLGAVSKWRWRPVQAGYRSGLPARGCGGRGGGAGAVKNSLVGGHRPLSSWWVSAPSGDLHLAQRHAGLGSRHDEPGTKASGVHCTGSSALADRADAAMGGPAVE